LAAAQTHLQQQLMDISLLRVLILPTITSGTGAISIRGHGMNTQANNNQYGIIVNNAAVNRQAAQSLLLE